MLGYDLVLWQRRQAAGWVWGDLQPGGPRIPLWRLRQDDRYAHEAALAAAVAAKPKKAP